MTNTLLKSPSSWYLRPYHLRNDHSFTTTLPPERFFPSEEEYYIRKYCPVSLGHWLPDLQFTRKAAITDATVEFDYDLRMKFEKHLNDSHRIVSASLSEDSSDSDNTSQLGNRIENDLSSAVVSKFQRLELHLPKVNYPEENMKFLLPTAELNNRRSSSVLTKNFCTGCINESATPKKSASYRTFHKRNKNRENSVGELSLPSIANEFSFSFKEIEPDEEYLCGNYKNTAEPLKDECLVAPPSATAKRDVSGHRSSTYNQKHPKHFTSSADESALRLPIKELCLECLPPSPYMIELARLRKEKLKIEEKLLLKRRQLLEVERLRSPAYKWYELKNERFHEEARRNSVYLKNEKMIPFIQERKRLLLETIKTCA